MKIPTKKSQVGVLFVSEVRQDSWLKAIAGVLPSETHLPLPLFCISPQLMCSSVQKALFEEEDHVKKLQQKVATLEKRNRQLRERVKKVKRSLRQARKNSRHLELVNQKLNEKLGGPGAQQHVNALGREPERAPYRHG